MFGRGCPCLPAKSRDLTPLRFSGGAQGLLVFQLAELPIVVVLFSSQFR